MIWLRYDRRDSEVTPPSILHWKADDRFFLINDQKWTQGRTGYIQKYQSDLTDLGLRDFIRDYTLNSGGPTGVSVDLHRAEVGGTDYILWVIADENYGDLGDIKVSKAANAAVIYNSGDEGIGFHFYVIEKLNQSV